MTDTNLWNEIDRYLAEKLIPRDPALDAALAANSEAGLPAIDVTPLQGKMLHVLARAVGARSVLEIGTLGGFSAIWLVRAVGPTGRVVTLEVNPAHAEVARGNLRAAGVDRQVELIVGAALDTLPSLVKHPAVPFDMVFIDADKRNSPGYLDWALKLSRVGTLILCDNVMRHGHVVDAASDDPSVVGMRELLDMMHRDERLSGTAIQTVGAKGHDGFMIAVVTKL